MWMRLVPMLAAIVMSTTVWADDKKWSMSDETYSCTTSGMTLQELASGGVTVVSHTPATKEYCEEAHKWGLKVCPYVSLYKVIDSTKGADLLREPFWKEVDASKHPEWYLRREDGEIRRPFEEVDYPAPFHQSCCNHRNLIEAYVRGVRNVMEVGADGVFVDNVHPYPKCYGPQLGLHAHDWPDKDNTECYKMALRKVYEAVKSYGPDRVVILNSGSPNSAYVGYGDSLMWESFIWRFGMAGDTGLPVKARRVAPRTWKDALTAYNRWKPFIEQGVSIAPLTYLPDKNTEDENAFFAYACAKLCGFEHWTATCAKRRDILRRLYHIRTGRPLTDLMDQGASAYRVFENALIVWNHSEETTEVTIPLRTGPRPPLIELFAMKETPLVDGKITLRLPPETGRILVPKTAALENLLREVEGQALAARLYVEKAVSERGVAPPTDLMEKLGYVQERAANCRKSIRDADFPQPIHLEALCNLSANLPTFGETEAEASIEKRLIKNAGKFSRIEIERLLNQPNAGPPLAQIEENAVTMKSCDTVARIAPSDRKLIIIGTRALELWVSPPPVEKGERWLHALRLRDVKLTADEPERKRVEGRIALRGKAQTEVKSIHGEFAVEARRGSPMIALDLRIVNDGEPYSCYAFLAAGGLRQTDPTKGTITASEAPDHRTVEWVYLHSRKEGGDGVLFTRVPAIGKSGGGSYIFGNPKSRSLAKDEAFDLSITAATLCPPLLTDRFLLERLENMRRHASLAAGLLMGISLECDAPKTATPGDAISVKLSLTGSGAAQVAQIQPTLRALLEGDEIKMTSMPASEITVPADAALYAGIDLLSSVVVTLRDGRALTLRALKTVAVLEPVEIVGRISAPPQRPGEARVGVRLRNATMRTVTVKVMLEDMPAGWKVAEMKQGCTIPPRETAEAILNVVAPSGSPNAQAQGTLKIQIPSRPEIKLPFLVKVSPCAVVPIGMGEPAVLAGFVNYKDASPVKEPTTANVRCDDKALYVSVKCSESRMDQLREVAVEDGTRTSPAVPQDDSVEVYVCPNMATGKFVRFAVNSANVRKSEAHGRWESSVSKGAQEWTVEFVLPYESIGVNPPRPGDAWGFNVCRNEQRLKEFSCWSCTYGAYAQPDRFGWILFSEPKGR